jgi:WD40 repeat protein
MQAATQHARAPEGESATRPDAVSGRVVISYARADIDHVRQLQAALKDRRVQVWLDMERIRPSAEWWAEICRAIDDCDSFLAVVTAQYLNSEVCRNELKHAVSGGKRIIPLRYEETSQAALPRAISERHWIDCAAEVRFDDIAAAIATDLEWDDEHARLLRHAREWEDGGRNASLLLRGKELARVEQEVLAHSGVTEPVLVALQHEFIGRSRRRARRFRRMFAIFVLSALAIAVGLAVFAFVQRERARHEASVATSRELASAATAQLPSDHQLALLLGLRAVEIEHTPQAVGTLRRVLRTAMQQPTVLPELGTLELASHYAVSTTTDGRAIAADGRNGEVWVWDARDLRHGSVAAAPIGDTFDDVELSAKGRWLAAAGSGGVALWSRDDRDTRLVLHRSGDYQDVAISADERRLVAGSRHSVRVWDLSGTRPRAEQKLAVSDPFNVAISADGGVIAAAGTGVKAWRLRGGEAQEILAAPERFDGDVAVTPGGDRVVVAGDGGLAIWAVGRRRASLVAAREENVFALALTGDGQLAAGTVIDGVRLWPLEPGKSPSLLRAPLSGGAPIATSRDGRWIAAEQGDGRIRVWDRATGEDRLLPGESGVSDELAITPDGSRLIAAGERIQLWNVATEQRTARVTTYWYDDGEGGKHFRYNPTVIALAFSRDGRAVGGVDAHHTTQIWEASSGSQVTRPLFGSDRFVPDEVNLGYFEGAYGSYAAIVDVKGQLRMVGTESDGTVVVRALNSTSTVKLVDGDVTNAQAFRVAFSTDGNRVAVGGGRDRRVTVYNIRAKLARTVLSTRYDKVRAVALDRTGDTVAAGQPSGSISIWKDSEPVPAVVISPGGGDLRALALSPDGARIASGSRDGSVRLWSIEDPDQPSVRFGHHGAVNAVAFSSDGRMLASGGEDGILRAWDVVNGGPPIEVGREQAPLEAVAISPDGRRMAAGTVRRISVWRCDACGPLSSVKQMAGDLLLRGFTTEERVTLLHENG